MAGMINRKPHMSSYTIRNYHTAVTYQSDDSEQLVLLNMYTYLWVIRYTCIPVCNVNPKGQWGIDDMWKICQTTRRLQLNERQLICVSIYIKRLGHASNGIIIYTRQCVYETLVAVLILANKMYIDDVDTVVDDRQYAEAFELDLFKLMELEIIIALNICLVIDHEEFALF
jgi:hypothetical protein